MLRENGLSDKYCEKNSGFDNGVDWFDNGFDWFDG